jgi:DNA-binding MarR family transcriptional regulator
MTIEKDHDITRSIIRCISHLERHRRKFINENLKDSNLRGSMFLALTFLKHNPGCSQDKLCNELLIDKGNAARLCRQLEETGYITRQQSPEDRRQNMLFLTEKGEEQIVQIRESLGQWRSAATEGMTDEEVEILARLLTQMKENVSKL